MNLDPGWNLDPKQLLRLQILDWLGRQPMNTLSNIVVSLRTDDDVHTEDDYYQAMQEFDGLGFIAHHNRGGTGMMTPLGRQALEQIDSVRNDRRARRRGVQDALLSWVEELDADDCSPASLDEFDGTPYAHWFGERFTDEQIIRASAQLLERGFITGPTTVNGAVYLMTITDRGRRLVEQGGSVGNADPPPSGGDSFTLHMGANSQAQLSGRGSTQTMTVTLSPEQRDTVDELVMRLRELGLTNPDADAAADEIEGAAASTDLGWFQRAVIGAQGAAMSAIGTEAGNQVVQLTHQLLNATH